jgi:4-hydroxy-tetrahydrodipicolinate synthase
MDFAALAAALRTVVAIPITPFTDDGKVDYDLFTRLTTRMVDEGITVITPNGNTSEYFSLSPQERADVIRAVVTGAQGRAQVISGVGVSIYESIELGQIAAEAGAAAVMVHQPPHPYRSTEGWLAYHQEIARGLPNIGIIPYIRDAAVTADAIRELAENCPNFVGVKYAVPNAILFAEIVRQVNNDQITWVNGLAESWTPYYWLGGAQGFTSGLVNIMPSLALALLHALQAEDYPRAMHLWHLLRPIEEMRQRRNNALNVSVVKEAMLMLGLCGRTVRPPVSDLTAAEREQVAAILQTWKQAAAAV